MPLWAERELVTMLYGAGVAAVLLFAAASRIIVFQKLALILLAAWMLTNVAFEIVGPTAYPLIYPTIEAGLGVVVAAIGIANRSRIALGVFLLYGLMIVTHIVAIAGGFTASYTYKAMINVDFIGQLLVVGGPSASMALDRLLSFGPELARDIRARR